jgi:hypothetical protein
MAQIWLNKEKTKYTTDALKGKMECEIILNENVDDGQAVIFKINDLVNKSISYTVRHTPVKKPEYKYKYPNEKDARNYVVTLKTDDILISMDDCQDGTIYLNRIAGKFVVSVIGFDDEVVFRKPYKTLNSAKKRMAEFQEGCVA